MTTIYVHTLGDSTLDNYWWMIEPDSSNKTEADQTCVEGQLQTQLNTNSNIEYEVVSHAYDGFTTSSVLGNDQIGRVLNGFNYPEHKKAYKDRKVPENVWDSTTTPLRNLRNFVGSKPNAVHYVVISVGGNDFRESLHNPIGILWEIPRIQERYLRIVQEVKSLQGKNIQPILVLQYRTDANSDPCYIYTIMKIIGVFFTAVNLLSVFGIGASAIAVVAGKVNFKKGLVFSVISALFLGLSSRVMPLKVTKGILSGQSIGMATLGGLMERFYKPILAKAREEKLPVLDLPNTFNPYEELYTSGIEPNAAGGRLIAEGIAHIVKREDSESLMYYKREDEWMAKLNNGEWKVDYPSKKQLKKDPIL